MVAYVLVAVSADVRRGLVRGAVVVTQLVAHDTPGASRSLRVCSACPSREMPSPVSSGHSGDSVAAAPGAHDGRGVVVCA